MNRGKFIWMRIASAIREKSCPICLRCIDDRRAAVIIMCMHAYCIGCIRKWSELKRNCPLCNAQFNSWFSNIRVSSGKFEQERLSPLSESKNVDIEAGFRLDSSERNRLVIQSAGFRALIRIRTFLRVLRRSRHEGHGVSRRSRQLPWRRSFGRLGSVPSEIIAERVLRWRASIYEGRLQAIPSLPRNCLEQNMSGNKSVNERIQQRIEPWIRRELQAVLGDSDPSVIVHLVTSLWILSLEEKLDVEDKFVGPLRPFLHDRANLFWHELSWIKVLRRKPMQSFVGFLVAARLAIAGIVGGKLQIPNLQNVCIRVNAWESHDPAQFTRFYRLIPLRNVPIFDLFNRSDWEVVWCPGFCQNLKDRVRGLSSVASRLNGVKHGRGRELTQKNLFRKYFEDPGASQGEGFYLDGCVE
ncbi:hypothetical protein HHK36_012468 [Tetracentron sinense]|uniref:RING-type E3 ubiquitin transferase n=1 Tax=Tetracentron sinense TaxID=13715 RepID=A0A834ZAG1_TETSI|nr:hypothetical protein HHK36_012468 [Tetracentron sinense]